LRERKKKETKWDEIKAHFRRRDAPLGQAANLSQSGVIVRWFCCWWERGEVERGEEREGERDEKEEEQKKEHRSMASKKLSLSFSLSFPIF
jgi:hypothetical protein